MKAKIVLLSLLFLSLLQITQAQKKTFTATKMGYCYKASFGWSEWSVYEQRIHLKVIIDPFIVKIENAKKESFQLKQIQTQFRGMDAASGNFFKATRYSSVDIYNEQMFVIIYTYDNGNYSVQLEYDDSKCYYTNEF